MPIRGGKGGDKPQNLKTGSFRGSKRRAIRDAKDKVENIKNERFSKYLDDQQKGFWEKFNELMKKGK